MCDCQVWERMPSSFRGSSGKVFWGASVFRSIILKSSKGKVFPEPGEVKGGVGKGGDLRTPVGSKFLSPVP